MPAAPYPKRLIEVDLPIKKISEHARREKSIRHGHISTLHIWWARKPLSSSRAVICAALWPDPADPLCPESFRTVARNQMQQFWNAMDTTARDMDDPVALRTALLDFIADFANWDNSTVERYITTARCLTQAAHEALGGKPGTRPLVVDPFAGGGSIPLEALRVGAEAYASDLNPVAVLLNKVVLEYIPKYGKTLADDLRKWGRWVKEEAEKELGEFYPKDPDGATPITYLWARTIWCEGPGCGAEVPLISSLWLAKKGSRSIAIKLVLKKEIKQIDFEIIRIKNPNDLLTGTVKRGSATCPICGYTTPLKSVRNQLKDRHGGSKDAKLMCVVTIHPNKTGRSYRLPSDQDFLVIQNAIEELRKQKQDQVGKLDLIPDEPTPSKTGHRAVASVQLYGMDHFEDLFTPRQALALSTFARIIKNLEIPTDEENQIERVLAIKTILALALDKETDLSNALTRWKVDAECPVNLFGRQAIPISYVFAESSLLSDSSGSWHSMYERSSNAIENCTFNQPWIGHIELGSATINPLPDDSVEAFVTDPPYYDAVPYADLSDFFYVWLKRVLSNSYPDLFKTNLTLKNEQVIVWHPNNIEEKIQFEKNMTISMSEGRRILSPIGIGVVIFAHKSTTGWEAMLQSMIDSGWIITGSWPIDTEMGTRMNARGTASLASSIHLVCRPRENPDGSLRTDDVGDWSEVLGELPGRIREWMPRLAAEHVVGADAIFACLGPALEIFSRYSRVEKASGEAVTLREYLEKVWEAVAREALGMIFEGADAAGFEEDARLTAMWLWTLKTGGNGVRVEVKDSEEDEDEVDVDVGGAEEGSGKKKPVKGYALEYDAARKIAQGLGANLDAMPTLVEVKKGKARLLPVSERAQYLLKKEVGTKQKRVKASGRQLTLFPGEAVSEEERGIEQEAEVARVGETTLNRIHQAMLLFGAGKSDALRRFLVEEGIGQQHQFWKLAQALAALYPNGSEEKRWVEGVLARKKGLGL